jgi:dihydrofolate reductase
MIRSIFSVDQRGGLGHRGSLPWANDPEDMQWFKEATTGHVVVMGRRTFEDPKFPKPLNNRTCVVFTNKKFLPHAHVVSGDPISVIKKLSEEYTSKDIWIIGGAELLMQTKDLCDEMWIAHRRGAYYTDVRVDMHKYMLGTRITSSLPNKSRTINWCTYKNVDIFRPYV